MPSGKSTPMKAGLLPTCICRTVLCPPLTAIGYLEISAFLVGNVRSLENPQESFFKRQACRHLDHHWKHVIKANWAQAIELLEPAEDQDHLRNGLLG